MNSTQFFFIAFLIAVGISASSGVLALMLGEILTGDRFAAMAVTTGVLILSFVTALSYASVVLTPVNSSRERQQTESFFAKHYRTRADRKIQTLQLRGAFVYAIIGGTIAEILGATSMVGVPFAFVDWLARPSVMTFSDDGCKIGEILNRSNNLSRPRASLLHHQFRELINKPKL